MASRNNRKVHRFVARSSDPQAHGVDALVIPWPFATVYVFPPLALLPRIIKKIKLEGTRAILVAPFWPRRSWFASLVAMAQDEPFHLPERDDLLSQGPIVHPNSHQWALTAWLLKP